MAVGALLGGVLLAAAHTHALPPQGRSIAAMRRPALAARTSSPFMKQNSPAALRGGSAEGAPASDDTARPENAAGDTALTTLLLALWYASSIVNNQSSKVLVSLLGAEVLTLNQLLISAGCGTLVLRQSPLRFDSRPHLTLTATLAASFLAGCYTLNSCLASMHVSLAMVLRSAEPLTTLALGAMLLPAKEQPPLRKALALLPVVLGCGLSAVGPHGGAPQPNPNPNPNPNPSPNPNPNPNQAPPRPRSCSSPSPTFASRYAPSSAGSSRPLTAPAPSASSRKCR